MNRGKSPNRGANELEPLAPDMPPGVVVAHYPQSSGVYVGSPSLIILPTGDYVATHDLFGPHAPPGHTHVYGSRDRGATWSRLVQLTDQFWSNLFLHRRTLYLFGTSREYGNVILRRSEDGGKNWSIPRDKNSGIIRDGGQYHCAPMPVAIWKNRLWRAFERRDPARGWAENFQSVVMSASESADLLRSDSWFISRPLSRPRLPAIGAWLEGNIVETREGTLVNVLRADTRQDEMAAIVEVAPDGRSERFDPAAGLIPFPGGAKKFTIRFDPQTGRYWSVATIQLGTDKGKAAPGSIRNTLALTASPDLRHWEVMSILLHHPEFIHHGFQYVDWQFDGSDDIAFVCRTAFDDGEGGAHNCHDSNFLTFHRVSRFRERTMRDPLLDGDIPPPPTKAGL